MYKSLPQNLIFKKTISFVTGRNCNLNCKYCYVTQDNNEKMTKEVAEKIVDYVLKNESSTSNGVIYEFIGGEPFLEIELIEHVVNYIKQKQQGHIWDKHHIFSICSNGTLFNDILVKKFLIQNKHNISLSLSLDGIKDIHDINRDNSYDLVMDNFLWWKENFPNDAVKSTLNHEALPYMLDSIQFMVDELDLPIIMMNTIFEDVWKQGDVDLFKVQLYKIADFLLQDKRYQKHHISLFNENNIRTFDNHNSGWCGCGNSMLAFNYKGDIYPCVRFCTSNTDYVIGNIENGINKNLILPFIFNHNFKNNCSDCNLKHTCPRCLSHDYETNNSTINRSAFICEMHKAKIEVNHYFFKKIEEIENETY